MATLTPTIDPGLLEAAKLEAERRNITLDQFFAASPPRKASRHFQK